MPYKSDKIAIKNEVLDRRVKLTYRKKEWVRYLRINYQLSQRELARMFGVSRRLIIFIIDPYKYEQNLLLRKKLGGSTIYYDRIKHNEAMKKHRHYKNKLYKEGKIK